MDTNEEKERRNMIENYQREISKQVEEKAKVNAEKRKKDDQYNQETIRNNPFIKPQGAFKRREIVDFNSCDIITGVKGKEVDTKSQSCKVYITFFSFRLPCI